MFDGATAVPYGAGVVDFGSTDVGSPTTHTFTVSNAGGADLTLGAVSLPAGFSLASGFSSATLAPGASTTFSVQLDAAAAGSFGGAVGFATNDPNQNPFTFTISGVVAGVASEAYFIDDGDPGFTATSGWQAYSGAGYQSDMLYKQAGDGSQTASWTFADLTPGQYQVWTTWVPYANRVPDANYTILAGTTTLGSATVDQRARAAGLVDQGASWQPLGGSFDLNGENLHRHPERPRQRRRIPDRRRRPHRADRRSHDDRIGRSPHPHRPSGEQGSGFTGGGRRNATERTAPGR